VEPDLKVLADVDAVTYGLLWTNLAAISDPEFDWRPHPEANSVRWILGHLIWFETWLPDAIQNTGRYLIDGHPTAFEVGGIDDARERFDRARDRLEALRATLERRGLEQEVDYFGAYMVSVKDLFVTHATHLAGHRYQIRYVRGTYARAHETDKAAFDRW
jgi:hypothetical protein